MYSSELNKEPRLVYDAEIIHCMHKVFGQPPRPKDAPLHFFDLLLVKENISLKPLVQQFQSEITLHLLFPISLFWSNKPQISSLQPIELSWMLDAAVDLL